MVTQGIEIEERFDSIDWCNDIQCLITTNVKRYYGSKGNWIYHNTGRKVFLQRTITWLDAQYDVHKVKVELDAI